MAFSNLSLLLLGGLTVVIPIVIHLTMRQRPKHQPFPAMQFLRKRQSANQRRLRVRQILLLLLRCAILLLLAFALAKPRVVSAAAGIWAATGILFLLTIVTTVVAIVGYASGIGRWFLVALSTLAFLFAGGTCFAAGRAFRDTGQVAIGNEAMPVAAAIVIDSSPRMGLMFENETRLKKGKRLVNWLLRQFPDDSDIAILDSDLPTGQFSVDRGAAMNAVDAIAIDFTDVPLPRTIESAVQLLTQSDRLRKEIYVITDLTQLSWKSSDSRLRNLLDKAPDVTLYLVDVGTDDVGNMSVDEIRLSAETVPIGSDLKIRVKLTAEDLKETNSTIQLQLEEPTERAPLIVDGKLEGPQLQPRGRQSASLSGTQTVWKTFTLKNLPVGIHHGSVQLEPNDPLEIDNRRFFTVRVRKPWRVLVASSSRAIPDFLIQQLAPLEFRRLGLAKFDFAKVDVRQLTTTKLDDYAVVCLLDPPPLPAATWKRLERYVRRGGGLAVFLGREANSQINSDAARAVLPASINRQWRNDDGVFLAPTTFDHSLLKPFQADDVTTVPWDLLPVFRHWGIKSLEPNTQIVVRFSDDQPALIERAIGQGKVVMMTTPVSDDIHDPSRPPWNLLPIGIDGTSWPFMMLADGILNHLAEAESSQLNYVIGQSPELRFPTSRTATRLQVLTPDLTWREFTMTTNRLQLGFVETPGTYRVFDEQGAVAGGFSLNLRPGSTTLARVTPTDLDQILGEKRYKIATKQEEIVREVDEARTGRDFYPFLMLILAVTLGLEQIISNRFYKATDAR